MSSTTLKFSFLVRESLGDELALLEKSGVVPRMHGSDGGLELVELAAAGVEAVASIAKYDNVVGFACAYFTGSERLELALRASQCVHVVPAEVLHVLARGAKDFETRYSALTAVGQVHADPEAGAGWDDEIQLTLRAAMQDDQPAIRLEAGLIAVRVAPRHAPRLLRELADREPIPEVRAELEALIDESGDAAEEVAETSPPPSTPRLAFPVHVDTGALRRTLAASGSLTELDGLESYEERAAPPSEARQRVLLDSTHGAACAFFDGRDAGLLALDAAADMHLLPLALAVATAEAAQSSERRVASIASLAMAASRRMLADDGGAGRAVLPVLERLVSDADAKVRAVAAAARDLV